MKKWSFGRNRSVPKESVPELTATVAPGPTKLFLRAYKSSENLTLTERTERILQRQRFVSDELKIWKWYLADKTEINIRDDVCYDDIYKKAKKGMNTKRAEIIRYQPNDIPDMQSRCMFFSSKEFNKNPFVIHHHLAWKDQLNRYEGLCADDFINSPEINNPTAILSLVDKIIDEYKPTSLYLTSKNYQLNIAKLPGNTPWTGWITYLDNSISLPKSMPDFCEVETKANGTLFKVYEEMFDDNNSKHTGTALKLEKWFENNKVKV